MKKRTTNKKLMFIGIDIPDKRMVGKNVHAGMLREFLESYSF